MAHRALAASGAAAGHPIILDIQFVLVVTHVRRDPAGLTSSALQYITCLHARDHPGLIPGRAG
jgi:hypothetical protein